MNDPNFALFMSIMTLADLNVYLNNIADLKVYLNNIVDL